MRISMHSGGEVRVPARSRGAVCTVTMRSYALESPVRIQYADSAEASMYWTKGSSPSQRKATRSLRRHRRRRRLARLPWLGRATA